MLVVSVDASATLIDFEDQSGAQTPVANGYNGLVWNSNVGDVWTLNGTTYHNQSSGYTILANALAGDNVAFNAYANSPVDITGYNGTSFDLTSAWFASAWDSVLTLNFTGLRNGVEVYSTSLDATRTAAQQVVFNWSNIDTFRIMDFGNHFAMDNLVINENASVPEPSTLALLSLGMAGFGFSRKKKTV
jgi:hypothetical protein